MIITQPYLTRRMPYYLMWLNSDSIYLFHSHSTVITFLLFSLHPPNYNFDTYSLVYIVEFILVNLTLGSQSAEAAIYVSSGNIHSLLGWNVMTALGNTPPHVYLFNKDLGIAEPVLNLHTTTTSRISNAIPLYSSERKCAAQDFFSTTTNTPNKAWRSKQSLTKMILNDISVPLDVPNRCISWSFIHS